ncbi:hypothetical protein JCM10213_008600 [Rhodosporidiobolus nylandii]
MQGFNKYYPPDYDPDKHSSLNSYHGKHALGDRARKIDQGILVVRFELPFNIWCSGCNNHIGQGVRYNAEKKQVGMYYSSKIWQFRMKCHLCQHWIEIRTDPQNTRYVVNEGARQKNETAEDPEADGMMVIESSTAASAEAPPPDPFASLEKTVTQKATALSASARLDALHSQNSANWDDPFAASQKLRAAFRVRKKVEVASETKARGTAERYGLASERVKADALRTPARGSVEEEEEARLWEEAKRERRIKEDERGKKRRREEEQLFPAPGSSSSSAGKRRHSSSTTSAAPPSSRQIAKLPRSSSASSSLSTLARPSSSSHSSSATASPAAKALHAKLALATRLKRDPFASPSLSAGHAAAPGSKGSVSGMKSSRSAPAGLASLAAGGSGDSKVKVRRIG